MSDSVRAGLERHADKLAHAFDLTRRPAFTDVRDALQSVIELALEHVVPTANIEVASLDLVKQAIREELRTFGANFNPIRRAQ